MVHSDVTDAPLVLVSARKSRGAGHWDKDDYDVRLGDKSGPIVGRIMLHPPGGTAVVLGMRRSSAPARTANRSNQIP